MGISRRDFVRVTATGAAMTAATGCAHSSRDGSASISRAKFKVSLAQWSLNRRFFGKAGEKADPIDFAKIASQTYGIRAIEYVNQFYMDKKNDDAYVRELKKRADGEGVRSVLIMCDREGDLGAPDPALRAKAIENHHRWADWAVVLGCHSIRVNARSAGPYEEQVRLAADGLRRLTEYGAKIGVNVIVENHGGLSSNGAWLASVMRTVNHPRCGTLPDFGNFRISPEEEYDRYKGVAEMMPFAKGVSAKSHEFNAQGDETQTDYNRMMRIVFDAGYRGYVGIEYEGKQLGEHEGIIATQKLLQRFLA